MKWLREWILERRIRAARRAFVAAVAEREEAGADPETTLAVRARHYELQALMASRSPERQKQLDAERMERLKTT